MNEKKYNKNFMLTFAKHCMMTLLQTQKDEKSIPQISGYDIDRIDKVLEKFKK